MRKPAPAPGGARVRPSDAEVAASGCPRSADGRKGARSSIMNVGKRVDYAIRALCYLAAQPPERIVRGAEIQ